MFCLVMHLLVIYCWYTIYKLYRDLFKVMELLVRNISEPGKLLTGKHLKDWWLVRKFYLTYVMVFYFNMQYFSIFTQIRKCLL